MNNRFFTIIKGGKANHRRGIINTPNGVINTPVFMPVGTLGPVKTTTPAELRSLGAEIILNNTYHLYLRPGVEIIQNAGGLHKFTSWDGPILTDSGGFQFYSLGALRKITDEGISFQSHIDGSKHFFSPETVIDIQSAFGSDIVMPLDVCLSSPSDYQSTRRAGNLTVDWVERSIKRFNSIDTTSQQSALFGIVQGGTYSDLRREYAQRLSEHDLPGYSIGGLAVGEDKELMWEMVAITNEILPKDKPRYLMGVGTPADIIRAVALGIDMFDCVMPTRNARNGTVFTHSGRLVIKGAKFARDNNPIEEDCNCLACRRFSRSYIRHLLNVNEILGLRLTTIHNLYFYLNLMREIRESIENDSFPEFMSGFLSQFEENC